MEPKSAATNSQNRLFGLPYSFFGLPKRNVAQKDGQEFPQQIFDALVTAWLLGVMQVWKPKEIISSIICKCG